MTTCPVCDKPSVLVRELDRYMHKDGSSNEYCRWAFTRGVTCPVCDKPSMRVEGLGRHIHLDGSSNKSCWDAATREW